MRDQPETPFLDETTSSPNALSGIRPVVEPADDAWRAFTQGDAITARRASPEAGRASTSSMEASRKATNGLVLDQGLTGTSDEAWHAFATEAGSVLGQPDGGAPVTQFAPDERKGGPPQKMYAASYDVPTEFHGGEVGYGPLLSGMSPRRPAPSRLWALLALVCAAALLAFYVFANRRPQAQTMSNAIRTGAASINSRPEGLQVVIDEEVRGVTPLNLTLPLGNHILRIQAGAEVRSIPLVIEAGNTASHYIELGSPATPSSSGRLEVTSEPSGSNVRLDGKVAGKTPLTLADIASGEHLVVVGTGDTAVTRRVTIHSGATASMVASFEKPPATAGWVSFKAPFEMQIFEAGRLVGTSSTDRVMLPTGVHQLDLLNTSLGFQTSTSVQVIAGTTVNEPVTVPNGSLSVNALPWADVTIDGEPVGSTPLANITLPIGSHQIVLTHPQHGERRQTAVVTTKTPARVGVDFSQ